jgi:hypothetical protein
VITRRGWWPALEPALLAFTVVVCGSVSLLANSRASAFDRDHQCDTSGSDRLTATATSPDSFDNRDDDDDVVDALLASPFILTSDDGLGGPVVQTEFDLPSSLRSERLSLRGPPDRDLPAWRTVGDSERHRQNSSDDSVDDDDDDDDTGDLGRSSFASGAGQSCVLIISEFDKRFSFASDNHSLRAPPQ